MFRRTIVLQSLIWFILKRKIIFFFTDCDSSFIEMPGLFRSPFYPDDYANFLNCKTVIKAPEGNLVVLDILDFALEWDFNTLGVCKNNYDTFSVYNGPDNVAPLLGTYCGRKILKHLNLLGYT